MVVEGIEEDASRDGVTEGVLLIKKTGIGPLLYIPPCTPFVYVEFYAFVFVVAIHNFFVSEYDIVHVEGFFHQGKPFGFVELGCVTIP
jgi:hypothetical protein